MTEIAGIPTRYGGTQYRSRLEAKWAAFFDLLEWPYEYEPLDLAGYIPDFVLKFPTPMLVEVKPVIAIGDLAGFRPAAIRIDRSGWVEPALVVGAALTETGLGVEIGWLRHRTEHPDWRRAQIGRSRHHWSPAVDDLHGCRAGLCPPSAHPREHTGLDFGRRTQLLELWRAAGNRVQWRGVGT